MDHANVWFLSAVLSVLIVQGKQDAQALPVPEGVNVSPGDLDDLGVWKMNIEWKDGFANSLTPETVTYDVKILYTEQMKVVHNETIELKANPMGLYNWSWTSPIPLQCTSHSVQLRYRDHDRTSDWSKLATLPGKDKINEKENMYPQNHIALVSEGIRFCCILSTANYAEEFKHPDFKIRISNRTYVTEPIRKSQPSPSNGFDILCMDEGATYYTGYAPVDHNLTCETRDLSSVECHWVEEKQANILKIASTTEYFINGRNCDPGICVLNQSIDTGVMNWTLIAKNVLGTKIIFDTADPKHRVRLTAPTLSLNTLFTARNATLKWIWQKLSKNHSFPMICQVEVNGHIINERYKGIRLTSAVLADLQPFTEYKVRVRCGVLEHFYKWGDWSNLSTFKTKEDIPEAVDVWMQTSGDQTYVVWKNLSAAQSHGIITGYELDIGDSADGNKERKLTNELCHELQASSAKSHHVISISAKNSAGVSRPSNITIPYLSSGVDVDPSAIKGNDSTFDMVWKRSDEFRCGYVLDWYPTFNAQQCDINWIKIPSSVSSAKVSPDTDIKEGVKYTLSVYGCTSGARYTLLQRREGYLIELPPSGPVQNLTAKQEGLNIFVSWRNVHEQEQRGFIKGYNVSCSDSKEEKNIVINDPSTQMYKFTCLPGKSYTFTVKAFTSAGDGPESSITLSLNQDNQVIINVVAGLIVMIFVLCIIAVLSYRNRKRLKSVVWPEVPKPKLSEEFLKKSVNQWQVLNQLLREESEGVIIKTPEICPILSVLELEKEHSEAQALNSPHSNDSTWTECYQTPNSNPQTVPFMIVDLSYTKLPCSGIQNLSYNLPLLPAHNTVLVSGYVPQT